MKISKKYKFIKSYKRDIQLFTKQFKHIHFYPSFLLSYNIFFPSYSTNWIHFWTFSILLFLRLIVYLLYITISIHFHSQNNHIYQELQKMASIETICKQLKITDANIIKRAKSIQERAYITCTNLSSVFPRSIHFSIRRTFMQSPLHLSISLLGICYPSVTQFLVRHPWTSTNHSF